MSVSNQLDSLMLLADTVEDQNGLTELKNDLKAISKFIVSTDAAEKEKLSALRSKIEDIEAQLEVMRVSTEEDEKKESPLVGRAKPIQRPPEGTHKVALQNARQYDLGSAPAACTFHAVCAMKEITSKFDEIFDWIVTGNAVALSAFQCDVIQNKGLSLYQNALAQDASAVEGADFKQVQPYLPAGIHLHQPENHNDLQSFDARLHIVLAHLSARAPQMKTVWLKTGNEESFAVIKNGNRAIIFDSHKNEIVATNRDDALQNALREKLIPYSQEVDGIDIVPFAYALTADEETAALQQVAVALPAVQDNQPSQGWCTLL